MFCVHLLNYHFRNLLEFITIIIYKVKWFFLTAIQFFFLKIFLRDMESISHFPWCQKVSFLTKNSCIKLHGNKMLVRYWCNVHIHLQLWDCFIVIENVWYGLLWNLMDGIPVLKAWYFKPIWYIYIWEKLPFY